MTDDRRDVYAMVTEQVINALEAGTVPWHKPWATDSGLPLSLSTHKPYRGINVLLLGLTTLAGGYRSPWWGTYKKIKEMGGQVRRGEKSTLVIKWLKFRKNVTDEATGEVKRELRFALRYYRVFNADQADWPEGKAPKYETRQRLVAARIDQAEKIVANYPNPPTIVNGRDAYYQSGLDRVTVPPLEAHESVEEYYSTLFHELTHSTGHDSRLKRDGIKAGSFGPFGSPVYSKEELVAEMGSALLCALAGINTAVTLPNSAAYLQGWINALKGDSRLIVSAGSQAQHAADHILGQAFADDDADEDEEA